MKAFLTNFGSLNNIRFTSYASQGQRRTAAIALKASESSFLEKKLAQKAIILVDDIFSELDEMRRSNMVKILGSGNQVIFTMVNADSLTFYERKNIKTFITGANSHLSEVHN